MIKQEIGWFWFDFFSYRPQTDDILRMHLRPEEQKLVQQSLRGNARAQRALYNRYVQAMYNTVIRMIPNPMDAEDVVQDGFIRVFQNLAQFQGNSTLGAWIKRIMINASLNFIRRQRGIHFLDIETTHPAPLGNEEPSAPRLDMKKIHYAIKELPEGCRLVFTLYLLEGYQHKEIAQILDISESTSKSQYHRARRLLQKQLKKQLIMKE